MRQISRRGVTTGLVAAVVAAALAGTLKFLHPFAPHYPPTQYDDLLARLTDRETGARLGKAVLAGMPGFNLQAAVMALRAGPGSLSEAVAQDAQSDRLSDVDGWLLPQSLALLCALAAKAG